MQGRNTYRINAYLNPDRAGDRAILARLRADRAHGLAISDIVRRALTEHYQQQPTPPAAPELADLAAALAGLTEQVRSLQATVQQLTAENADLRVTLAMAAFGDKAQRSDVLGAAARLLVRPNGNGRAEGASK
jgi:hypothetical protein